MLQIQSISKQYVTGSLIQAALKDVSLNLRDNEFVAILGPSGSGKTTLLNIIGGLDRYDSGDLVINGTSTKKYRDRDWDSYRNHTIGFVFQSYNLIPHQSVLANVELALTIGGISRAKRTALAKEALEKVGLSDHMHKKPNQLSGGQMQRVAIARALVNDPDILLADEPTGALDSETSVQVMDLLKEVAQDRLVVMVTHNPDLAERYATRIVTLRDGQITGDSDPFQPEVTEEAVHRNLGKASMSFGTSLALSFNNLRTKLTRTLLIAFAGSIGIIGIALIMSLSNGVNDYIQRTEEETLKEYPLSITKVGFDMSNLVASRMGGQEESSSDPEGTSAEAPAEVRNIREMQTITTLFATMSSNDLAALKRFLESPESGIAPYVKAIEYSYSLTPLIYRVDEKKVTQINPDQTMKALGYDYSMSGFSDLFSSYTSYANTDVFHAMPEDESLFKEQYELVAGKWPENWNECIVVLYSNGGIADIALYDLGLKDSTELEDIIKTFLAGGSPQLPSWRGRYRYEDFLGRAYKFISPAQLYAYDSEYKVWTNKAEDSDYVDALVRSAEDLTIVGVVKPQEDANISMLMPGVAYPASLVKHYMELATESAIVQAQLADPDTDVISGRPFGETSTTDLDLSTLFNVDEDKLKESFNIDLDSFEIDPDTFSDLDFSEVDLDLSSLDIDISELDLSPLMNSIRIRYSQEAMRAFMERYMDAYMVYAAQYPETDWDALPSYMQAYLRTQEARDAIRDKLQEISAKTGQEVITEEDLTWIALKFLSGYTNYCWDHGYLNTDRTEEYMREYLASEEGQALMGEILDYLWDQFAEVEIPEEEVEDLIRIILEGYEDYAREEGGPIPSLFAESFGDFVESPEGSRLLREQISSMIDTSGVQPAIQEIMGQATGQMSDQMEELMQDFADQLGDVLADQLSTKMEDIFTEMQDSFRFDPDAFADAISMNFSQSELLELMQSLMSKELTTYDSNMSKFGYITEDDPNTINIYPTDFEGKEEVKKILDAYNERMKEENEDLVIAYTDMVGTLMSSVTSIINAISYVLIAFVAISLVVSSIMIGVITYISVLERRKEIGILRAIGASKRNISQVFNAETIIIGILAGTLGVVVTQLILIPANIILVNVTGEDIRAFLPLDTSLWLILLSTVLTVIGGLIPSGKASRSDPVLALRSE